MLARLLLFSFIAAACTASLLAVQTPDGASDRSVKNHWQELEKAEAGFDALKAELAGGRLPGAKRQEARHLAAIYRQEGKLAEAAAIYRLLWNEPDPPAQFVRDGRELAAIYLEMAAFPSAIESYQKILAYDRSRLAGDDHEIALDLNNLGLCYFVAGSCSPVKDNAAQYFSMAGHCFDDADSIAQRRSNSALPRVSASRINKEVLGEHRKLL